MMSVVEAGVMMAVVLAAMAVVSGEILHEGLLLNALPNVMVHVEEASADVVTIPMPFAPMIEGVAPHAETVSAVPVEFMGPWNVDDPVTDNAARVEVATTFNVVLTFIVVLAKTAPTAVSVPTILAVLLTFNVVLTFTAPPAVSAPPMVAVLLTFKVLLPFKAPATLNAPPNVTSPVPAVMGPLFVVWSESVLPLPRSSVDAAAPVNVNAPSLTTEVFESVSAANATDAPDKRTTSETLETFLRTRAVLLSRLVFIVIYLFSVIFTFFATFHANGCRRKKPCFIDAIIQHPPS